MHPVLHHIILGRKGRLIADSDYPALALDKYGLALGSTLRADLVDLLASPLKQGGVLSYSTEVCSLSQSQDGVTVGLTDGRSLTADLVVGADGINSFVARTTFGDKDPPIHSKENIFYGVIDSPVTFHSPLLGKPNTLVQQLDQGEFIYFPVGGKDNPVVIWAMTYKSTKPPRRDEWEGADGVVRGELEKILRQKDRPDHPAWECLAHTKSNRLLHFGLFYRRHKPEWTKGRVCLLGDAAHATLPYVGQGANQAIEDGIVLVNCLEKCRFKDHDQALRDYYNLRHQRTKLVVDTAWYLGKIMHTENALAEMARDAFLSYLIKSGTFFKMAEAEIVQNCPVPYDPSLARLSHGWQ